MTTKWTIIGLNKFWKIGVNFVSKPQTSALEHQLLTPSAYDRHQINLVIDMAWILQIKSSEFWAYNGIVHKSELINKWKNFKSIHQKAIKKSIHTISYDDVIWWSSDDKLHIWNGPLVSISYSLSHKSHIIKDPYNGPYYMGHITWLIDYNL